MQFPPVRLSRSLAFLLLFSCPLLSSEQKPEASHRERFAPLAQGLARAEQELNLKLEKNPHDPHLWSDRGLLKLEIKPGEEALQDLRKAVALVPADAQLRVNLAYGLLVGGYHQEAATEARQALSTDPNNAAGHALLGRILVGGDASIHEGIEHIQRSLAIFPDQPGLRFDLINALRKLGDYAAAGIQMRILKDSLPPDNIRLEYTQGVLFADLGHPEAAAASFRRALAHDPDFSREVSSDSFRPEANLLPIWQDLGVALVHAGRWEEATRILAPVARARPDLFQVAYLHALALENFGATKAAEGEARRAVSLQENSADARTLLGITLSAQSRFSEAVSELGRAVALDPSSFDAHMALGRARYGLGDAVAAAEALAHAVKIRPADAEARFLLGTVLEIAGDTSGAEAAYHELEVLSPEDPRGYLGLGSMLSKYGRNEEAIHELQRAHSLAPDNFEVNMALGRLLAKTGKFEESIPWLEQASREQPNSPEVHYQLALSLERAGKSDEASREFAEVERLNQQRRSGAPQP